MRYPAHGEAFWVSAFLGGEGGNGYGRSSISQLIPISYVKLFWLRLAKWFDERCVAFGLTGLGGMGRHVVTSGSQSVVF